jgi:hypothetical protein
VHRDVHAMIRPAHSGYIIAGVGNSEAGSEVPSIDYTSMSIDYCNGDNTSAGHGEGRERRPRANRSLGILV